VAILKLKQLQEALLGIIENNSMTTTKLFSDAVLGPGVSGTKFSDRITGRNGYDRNE